MNFPVNFATARRINVIGNSGSGKSTFSKNLASIIGVPYFEIDKLYWRPNWQYISREELAAALTNLLAQDTWVLDGNYHSTAPVKWKRVQMIIWLDYPFTTVIYRSIKRAIWRAISNVELWDGTGNKETFTRMMGKESIIRWTIQTYDSNKKKYEQAMSDNNYRHIQFIRLKSPKQARHFLQMAQVQMSV